MSSSTIYPKIAKMCVEKFSSFPKNGKPKENEWTVLAGIVESSCSNLKCMKNIYTSLSSDYICNCSDLKLETITVATGTKCIGTEEWSKNGGLVHDCHAEVLVKRSFQLYLIEQMKKFHKGSDSIFKCSKERISEGFFSNKNDEENHAIISNRLELKEGVKYHLYISHTPCGDCSIFPKDIDCNKESINSSEAQLDNSLEPQRKKLKICKDISHDIHRTGAKCVEGENKDSKEAGASYHEIGTLRRKPGRGNVCLSHSCSDKIFRWNVLGIQGNFLTPFLTCPIYLTSIVLGKCPSSITAMKRGIFDRFRNDLDTLKLQGNFRTAFPTIIQTEVEFAQSRISVDSKFSSTSTPCASSLIWLIDSKKPYVVVEGRKHGVIKKLLGTEKSYVPISKYQKLKAIQGLYQTVYLVEKPLKSLSYKQIKNACRSYCENWNQLRSIVLPNWTKKPSELEDFALI